MIKEIQKIISVGKFYNFVNERHVKFFSDFDNGNKHSKLSVIYSDNGYGKTTLCSIFKSLSTGNCNFLIGRKTLSSSTFQDVRIIDSNDITYDFKNGHWLKQKIKVSRYDPVIPEIEIFDQKYIHENLFTTEISHNHKVKLHEIVFGKAGIQLSNEIVILKSKIKQKKVDLKSNFKDKYEAEPKEIRFEDFTKLKESDYNPEDIIKEIANIKYGIESNNLPKIEKFNLISFGYNFEDLSNVLNINLNTISNLAKGTLKAKQLINHHLNSYNETLQESTNFIAKGLKSLQVKFDNCPFCGQSISADNELISAYQSYFNIEYRKAIFNLQQELQSFSNWDLQNQLSAVLVYISTLKLKIKQYSDFDIKLEFSGLDFLEDINIDNILSKKKTVQDMVSTKLLNIEEVFDFEFIYSLLEEIEDIKSRIQVINNEVEEVQKKLSQASSISTEELINSKKRLRFLKECQSRFTEKGKEWVESYVNELNQLKLIEDDKSNKEKAFSEYTHEMLTMYVDRINELLTCFSTGFNLSQLKIEDQENFNKPRLSFGIIIRDEKININHSADSAAGFHNTLSEGDKNSLALAFFIASLENGEFGDLNKRIVIFDDPLSSLDETRTDYTAEILVKLQEKVSQIIILTHKKNLLKSINTKAQSLQNIQNGLYPKVVYLKIHSDKLNGSILQQFDFQNEFKLEFHKILDEIDDFIDCGTDEECIKMQANIRKVLESLLSFKFYHKLRNQNVQSLNSIITKLDDTLKPEHIVQIKILASLSNIPSHQIEFKNNPDILSKDALCTRLIELKKLLLEL